MSKEKLQESLDALKSEIAKLDQADPDVRDRVEQLISDCEGQLDDPDATEEVETISERVAHFVEQMEIEHPITETLNRFLTALGEIGI